MLQGQDERAVVKQAVSPQRATNTVEKKSDRSL